MIVFCRAIYLALLYCFNHISYKLKKINKDLFQQTLANLVKQILIYCQTFKFSVKVAGFQFQLRFKFCITSL